MIKVLEYNHYILIQLWYYRLNMLWTRKYNLLFFQTMTRLYPINACQNLCTTYVNQFLYRWTYIMHVSAYMVKTCVLLITFIFWDFYMHLRNLLPFERMKDTHSYIELTWFIKGTISSIIVNGCIVWHYSFSKITYLSITVNHWSEICIYRSIRVDAPTCSC